MLNAEVQGYSESNVIPTENNNRQYKAILKGYDSTTLLRAPYTFSLTISVGQPVHEGEKLASLVATVNKYFAKCNVMVCDTLQRHTWAIRSDESMEYINKHSLRCGDD